MWEPHGASTDVRGRWVGGRSDSSGHGKCWDPHRALERLGLWVQVL